MSDILKKQDLFRLIRSMTMSEKRYFKIYSSKHVIGDKNGYVKLFDAIDKQHEYDERIIFKNEKYIGNLSSMKNRLYEIILRSLEVYSASVTVESRLKGYMHQIKILFDRQLYDQCERVISRAKSIANEYEHFVPLIDILEKEIELNRIYGYSKKTEEEVEGLYVEIDSAIEKQKNLTAYKRLTGKLYMKMAKSPDLRSSEDIKYYKNIIDDPLFSSEAKALSVTALYQQYVCITAFFHVTRNYQKAAVYAEKQVKLLESKPSLIGRNPGQYIVALNNLGNCLIQVKAYKASLMYVVKLKGFSVSSEKLSRMIFGFANNMESVVCINTGKFDEGIGLIDSIEKNPLYSMYEQNSNKTNAIRLYYHFAHICIGAGAFKRAKLYLNRIINDSSIDVQADMHSFSRILRLIADYEMGNQGMLEYDIRSTYRFLKTKDRINEFEKILLKFLRNNADIELTTENMKNEFKKPRKLIVKVFEDPLEKGVLEYFDFISWLESKIENKSFAEIVKKKALL